MKVIEYIRKGKKYSVSKFDKEAEDFLQGLLSRGVDCCIVDVKSFPDPPGKPHYSCSGSGRMSRDFSLGSLNGAGSLPGREEK